MLSPRPFLSFLWLGATAFVWLGLLGLALVSWRRMPLPAPLSFILAPDAFFALLSFILVAHTFLRMCAMRLAHTIMPICVPCSLLTLQAIMRFLVVWLLLV